MTGQQTVLLGPVTLQGFEVPEQIMFGGGQRIAVHELIGGGRVIDTLGAAAEEIALGGIFSGPDAALRVQSLDAARILGTALPISWGDFAYTVIIAEFSTHYEKSWWIPYALRLVVVEDPVALLVSVANQAALDFATGAGFAGSAGVTTSGITVGVPASFAPSLAGLSQVMGAAGAELTGVSTDLTANMSAQAGAAAVMTAVQASGILANATAARGYLARAQANQGAGGA